MENKDNSGIPTEEVVFCTIALAQKTIKEILYNDIYLYFQKLVEKHPDFFKGIHVQGDLAPYSKRLEDIFNKYGIGYTIGDKKTWLVPEHRKKTKEAGFMYQAHYFKLGEECIKRVELDIKTKYGREALIQLENIAEDFVAIIREEEGKDKNQFV